MSKILGCIGGIVSISAIVTAAVLLGNNDSSKINEDVKKVVRGPAEPISDAQRKYRNVKCLKEFFGKSSKSKATVNKKFPSNVSALNSESAESCLSVSWSKETYKNKWKGNFLLAWSIFDNKQALVTIVEATADKGKLSGTASLYFMEKGKDKSRWNTKNLVEKENKDIKKPNDWLPQQGELMTELKDKEKFWGFNPKLKDICQNGECTNKRAKKDKYSGSWKTSKSEEEGSIEKWCSDLKKWFGKIFKWNKLDNLINNLPLTWVADSTPIALKTNPEKAKQE